MHQASLTHTMADQDTPSRRRKRDHSPELKRELVRQCLLPGASVSSIAMVHGINANLVFKWRREHHAVEASGAEPAQASAPSELAKAARYSLARWKALTRYVDDGRIEIDNSRSSAHCEVWRSVAATNCSWARTPAVSARRRCTASSRRPSSTGSIPRPICARCWSGSPTIR